MQLLEEHLTPEMMDQVEISGSPCLDFCNRGDEAKAPFAMVNNRVVSDASISKIIKAINEELESTCL